MSFSAPQSKMPSPARTPRVSHDDDGRRPAAPGAASHDRERHAERAAPPRRVHKPAGIVNMGMTCFLNSTFQALSATPSIIALLSHNPALPMAPAPLSLLPPPAQHPQLTPCLLPDSLEPPVYSLLPITRAFTNCLHKAWTTKERGGGIAGPGESSSLHSITLSQLLREVAKKYDQYDAFAQQDAHELLRHLLDSMEMEEKDVKKWKTAQAHTLAYKAKVAAAAEAAARPSDPSTPTRPPTPPLAFPLPAAEDPLSPERMLPFVDLLFGGVLASVVVCDTCKSVSHTYEGFLDLSLSMRVEDGHPRVRKRDRFRSITSRLKPHAGKRGPGGTGAFDSVSGVMSEPEGSDTETSMRFRFPHRHADHTRHHRDSDPETDGVGSHHGNGSGSSGIGLGAPPPSQSLSRASSSAKSLKASFSFRKKKDKKESPTAASTGPAASPALSVSVSPSPSVTFPGAQPVLAGRSPPVSPSLSPQTESTAALPSPHSPRIPTPHSPLLTSHSPLASSHTLLPSASLEAGSASSGTHGSSSAHAHGAAPTPAQTAYIARILHGPPAPPETLDPLAKLRAAHAGGLGSLPQPSQEYGLIDSLRAFMGVETLEGDNAFACHKCWKIKHGRYKHPRGRGKEASMANVAVPAVVPTTPDDASAHSSALALPSIAIEDSESEVQALLQPSPSSSSSSLQGTPLLPMNANGSSPGSHDMSTRLGRLMSRGKGAIVRAASPLRHETTTADEAAGPAPAPAAPGFENGLQFTDDSGTIGRTVTATSTDSATTFLSATSASAAPSSPTVTASASMASLSMTDTLGISISRAASSTTMRTSASSVTDTTLPVESDPTRRDHHQNTHGHHRNGDRGEYTSSDGLSDSETSDDDSRPSSPPRHHPHSPLMLRYRSGRRPSKHFILRRAFKRYLITKAPEVLVFHIKRFKQMGSDVYSTFSSLTKLDDPVTFPEMLDLAPFMAPNRSDFKMTRGGAPGSADGGTPHAPYMDWPAPDRPPEPTPMPYKLYAVVVHLGTMLSGHYIAYVLVDPEKVLLAPGQAPMPPAAGVPQAEGAAANGVLNGDAAAAGAAKTGNGANGSTSSDGRSRAHGAPNKDRRVWCYCSDTEIRLANVQEVLAARAYLCFYERIHDDGAA